MRASSPNPVLNRAFETIRANSVPLLRQARRELPDVDLRKDNNNTLLILAVHAKHYRLTKMLLDAGADIDVMGRHNRTPISLAAEAKNSKVLNLLLQRGGDPNLYPVGDF